MNLMTIHIAVLLTASFAAPQDRPSNVLELKPQYDLDGYGIRGRATLSADKERYLDGEAIRFEIRFATKTGGRFHNIQLSAALRRSARLAVFDNCGKYIGDALDYRIGKARAFRPHWTNLVGSTYIGHFQYFEPGAHRPAFNGKSIPRLQPGNYKLQLIYLKSFVVFPTDKSNQNAFNEELFRSNILDIEIKKTKRDANRRIKVPGFQDSFNDR